MVLPEQISEEIMQEVANLNRSIKEFCPEVASAKFIDRPLKEEVEMKELIQHRINILSENSEPKLFSNA